MLASIGAGEQSYNVCQPTADSSGVAEAPDLLC